MSASPASNSRSHSDSSTLSSSRWYHSPSCSDVVAWRVTAVAVQLFREPTSSDFATSADGTVCSWLARSCARVAAQPRSF
eukprot:5131465-Heterocapsa_arctica.AAC.1